MAQNELPLSTSDAKQPVKIRLGKDGLAAIEPKTVMQTWNETVVRLGDHPALYQKRPAKVSMRDDRLTNYWRCSQIVLSE